MSLIRERPITLAPVPPAGHQLSERTAVIHLPRRVIRHAAGTAVRLFDIVLSEDPSHAKDVVYYGMLLKFLAGCAQVPNRVHAAYVINDPESPVITLLIVLKCNLEHFAAGLLREAENNCSDVPGVEPPEPVDNEEGGGGRGGGGRGAGGRSGGGRGAGGRGAGAKRKRYSPLDPDYQEWKWAHDQMGSDHVPVFEIAKSPKFKQRPLGWGSLVHGEEELSEYGLAYTLSRLKEENPTMAKVCIMTQRPPQEPQKQADDDDDDEYLCPADNVAALPKCSFIWDVTLYDGTKLELKVHPDKLFSPQHTVDGLRGIHSRLPAGMYLIPSPHVSKLTTPNVHLPDLASCFIPPSSLFEPFQSFCQRMEYEHADRNEVNQPGLPALASLYFDAHPDALTNKSDAAGLVFDVMSRPSGNVPTAVKDLFSVFHACLAENQDYLAPVVNGVRQPGTGEPIVRYSNLSFSANYVLYILRNMESNGTFYFHIEQILLMMVLDTTGYRSRCGADLENQCAHLINFGPPGIGKSEAGRILVEALSPIVKATSYASAKSHFAQLRSADQLDHKASVYDEAPEWIVNTASRPPPAQLEQVAALKERLTSGRMSGERLTIDPRTGVYETKDYNVRLEAAPFIAHTNAPEQSGNMALQSRFINRFWMHGDREVRHFLQSNTPSSYDKRPFVSEMRMQAALMMAASKLQSDCILPPVELTVFTQYYGAFLKQLALNPYLNCDVPNPKDRSSQTIQLLFEKLSMRTAIHKQFLERPCTTKFGVGQLLELGRYSAYGDLQNTIFAVCSMEHTYRSPTEYRVAELCGARILRNIAGWDHKEYPDGGPRAPEHRPEDWRSLYPDAQAEFENASFDDGKEAYIFLYHSPPLTARDEHFNDLETALGGSSGGHMLPEHATRRLHLLRDRNVRCGPDEGKRVLLHFKVGNEYRWFVLRSWLEDCLEDREWGVPAMLKKAAMSMSYTSPGTYVLLQPLKLEKGTFIPHLLESFTVPVHEAGCPARVEAEEGKSPHFYTADRRVGCTCFRSHQLGFRDGDQEVHIDPAIVSLGKARASEPAAYVCINAALDGATYPGSAVAAALTPVSAVPTRSAMTAHESDAVRGL